MVTIDRKDDFNFVKWASEVKRRDFYTCQVCGRRGVELNAHHILSWSDNPNERYDLDNGVSLCSNCHDTFHLIYGKGGNNEIQFNEFSKIAKDLLVEAEYQNEIESQVNKFQAFADGYSVVDKILEDLKKKE